MPFRAVLFVCFGVVVAGLWGCGRNHEKAIDNNSKDSTNTVTKANGVVGDTIIQININGKHNIIHIRKQQLDKCLDIEKLATKFNNRPLDSSMIRYLDITGDGITEKIIGHVYIKRDSAIFSRIIYEGNKIIFSERNTDFLNDTSDADDREPGIEKELSALEPYASFQKYINGVDIINDTVIFKLSDVKIDTLDTYYPNNFLAYAKKFKGAIINSHTGAEGVITPEIWYEPKRKFIELLYVELTK